VFIARAAALSFLILTTQTIAQTPPDDLTRCGDIDADTSISACTGLITSTVASGASRHDAGQPEDTLAKAYTYRGFSYLKKTQYDHAIEDFNQAIQRDPNNAWAFANRGNAYFNTRQPERAMQDYDQALKLNPAGYATLFYGRVAIYTSMGDFAHAITEFDQAIRLQPEFPEAFNNRGIAYFDNGQYGRAIEDYGQALHFRPDYPSALNNRGNAYAAKGQYDRALEDYNKGVGLQPVPTALRNRGNAYRAKGDYEKALADLNAAIHSLVSPAALDERGDIYLELGQNVLALEDFSAAVRSQADDPDALQSKARAEFYLGQWNDAVTDFQKSLSLDDSNPYTLIWLHLASVRAGKNDDSALQQQAINVHPAGWPAPIVDLLLGKLKPAYAVAFASDPDPDKTTSQRCEAEFYVGEYMLTQSNTDAALPHLQEAHRICSGIFAESLAAKMELKRIQNAPRDETPK
jgi:tetratricopeptide (TPR) repeat protein